MTALGRVELSWSCSSLGLYVPTTCTSECLAGFVNAGHAHKCIVAASGVRPGHVHDNMFAEQRLARWSGHIRDLRRHA